MLPCFTNDPAAIVAHNVLEVHASGTLSRERALRKGLEVTRDASSIVKRSVSGSSIADEIHSQYSRQCWESASESRIDNWPR